MSARSSGTKVLPRSILAGWRTLRNSHTSSVGGSDNSSAYLGVNAGLSWDGWLLKHRQPELAAAAGKAHWNSNQTYLQRPYPTAQLRHRQRRADFHQWVNFFDTIGLRGVNLSTDDNMFPDGMRSYAPEIRGVAQSNALVTVRQGSNIIYRTTVPPGPFTCRMSILPAMAAILRSR